MCGVVLCTGGGGGGEWTDIAIVIPCPMTRIKKRRRRKSEEKKERVIHNVESTVDIKSNCLGQCSCYRNTYTPILCWNQVCEFMTLIALSYYCRVTVWIIVCNNGENKTGKMGLVLMYCLQTSLSLWLHQNNRFVMSFSSTIFTGFLLSPFPVA